MHRIIKLIPIFLLIIISPIQASKDKEILYCNGEFSSGDFENLSALDKEIMLNRTSKALLHKFEVSSIIGRGPSNGEFAYPFVGIALDENNNIYVSDTSNSRIQVFDSSGKFLKKFGGYGGNEGEFRQPHGIVIDEKNIYVADTENNRIQIFDKNGKFIRQFGKFGSAPGNFFAPVAICVDESKIYVADTRNSRVQIFDKEGKFIKQFGRYGIENNEFAYPQGIATDSKKNIYVSDTGHEPSPQLNSKIKVFDNNGKWIKTIGAFGKDDYETSNGTEPRFFLPGGLDLDEEGNLYVADSQNNMIKIIDKEGKLLRKFGGHGLTEGQFALPSGLTVSKNNIYVVDSMNNRVQIFDKYGNFISYFGNITIKSGHFAQPMGLAIKDNTVYVCDWGHGRFQWFSNGTYKGQAGNLGTSAGEFIFPVDLAFNENLYVLDNRNNRVQVFNKNGDFLFLFGNYGEGLGAFRDPRGISLSSKNEIFVLDSGNNRIQIFDKNGNYIRMINGSKELDFTCAFGIELDKNDRIYITSAKDSMVLVMNTNGTLLKKFGGYGRAQGEFKEPMGITVDDLFNIYVVDTKNHRIQMFDSNFNFLREFGSYGRSYSYELGDREDDYTLEPGRFNYPWFIAFQEGKLYVSDRANRRVQVIETWGYNYNGSFVSLPQDLKANVEFINLSFNASLPIGTEIKFQIRTGRNESEVLNSTWYGPKSEKDYYNSNGTINPIHKKDRFLQYRALFSTTNYSYTPVLYNITISYSYIPIENKTLVQVKPTTYLLFILVGCALGTFAVIGYREIRYRYKIEEIFLVDNAGLVLSHVSKKETLAIDKEIVAGMITAIQDFVKDAFRKSLTTEKEKLGKLEYGKYVIVIERGAYTFLSAVIIGYDNKRLRNKMAKCIKEIEEKYEFELKKDVKDKERFYGIENIIKESFGK